MAGKILPVLHQLRLLRRKGGSPTLGDLVHGFGSEGPAMIIFVMSLPFLTPVSLGPLSSAASVVMAILAVQVARNSTDIGLPKKYLAIPLPQMVLNAMRRIVGGMEVRARRAKKRAVNSSLAASAPTRAEQFGFAALIIFCAFLLALPIPMLPFSNTVPALGLVFTAYGYLTRKPNGFVLGLAFAILSVAYFSLLYFAGKEAIQAAMDYFSYSKEGSGS
jgi:hypothetical protein